MHLQARNAPAGATLHLQARNAPASHHSPLRLTLLESHDDDSLPNEL